VSLTAERTAPAVGADVPVAANGLELIGELPGSGHRVPPSLVRRSDGQTIQLTRLLYLVLEAVDGERTCVDIASAASDAYGCPVRPEHVRQLIHTKLRLLGLLRRADGSEPPLKRANPLLALRWRYAVTNAKRSSPQLADVG
jgi:putative peptide zinc metalloprotease protein